MRRQYRVHWVIMGIWVAAAALFLASGLADDLVHANVRGVTIAALLAVAFVVLERSAIPLSWRGQRITMAFTEPVVFLGLALGQGPLLVMAAAASRIATGLLAGRPARKTAFNVGQYALATTLALLPTVFLTPLHVAPGVSAAIGTVLFTITADSSTALVLSIVGHDTWRKTFAERFGPNALLQIVVGICLGIVLFALVALAPFLVLAVVPLAWIAYRAGVLQARAERENILHHELASRWQQIAGCTDDDAIARVVLETCRDVLPAGKVAIELADVPGWEASWDAVGARPDLSVPLALGEGRIGTLHAWKRPGKP